MDYRHKPTPRGVNFGRRWGGQYSTPIDTNGTTDSAVWASQVRDLYGYAAAIANAELGREALGTPWNCQNQAGASLHSRLARRRTAPPGTQKPSGFSIGNLAEPEWRISAGFRAVVADRHSV